MAKAFKQTQDKWCETLLRDEDLCDAVAVVGPERQRVPFIRAHLATISQPLRAALYGEFQEGQTRELILPHVSVDAFDVMIRSAYHMEPRLTPHRALHALRAARLYMIDGLEKYCNHYLQHLADLDGITSLKLLSEALTSSMALPAELQRTFCKKVLAQCQQVLESPFFLETHGSIVAALIKSDNFDVREDRLWDRLMKWSAAAVQKPELLVPFADVTSFPPWKRPKPSTWELNSMNPHQVTRQEEVFHLMLSDIRFTQMSPEFFIDKAREYLDREESEAVMDYFVLRRETRFVGFVFKPRSPLLSLEDHGVSELLDCTLEPALVVTGQKEIHKVNLGGPVQVTLVTVVLHTIDRTAVTWSVWLARKRSEEVVEEYNTNLFSPGHSTSRCSEILIEFENRCNELVLEFSATQFVTVKRIIVKGIRIAPELEHANQVVEQLCQEIFPAPESNNPDASQ